MPTTRTKDSPFLPTDPDISKKATYYTVYLYLDGSKLVTRLRSHFYSGLAKDVSLDPLHEVTVYVLEHDPDTTITLT